jgi:hypothetical protein
MGLECKRDTDRRWGGVNGREKEIERVPGGEGD